MTTQPWQAAITRWGDPVFRLALLLTDTYAAAEEATVQTFTQTLSAEHADLETALYASLLAGSSQGRWQLPGGRVAQLIQRRASARLPQSLARVAPRERALLGLWLLRNVSGARLVTIARMPAPELAERLAETLLRLLPTGLSAAPHADSPPEQPDLAAFTGWLRHKLALDDASPVHLASDAQHAAEARWQAGLDQLRLQLHSALDDRRLPLACSDAIESNLLTRQSGGRPQWWERPATWAAGVVAVALLWLLWLVLPGGTPASTSAQTTVTPQTARQIVQQALDGWTTQPVSGTIQRTVWALPPTPLPALLQPNPRQRVRRDIAQVTDVWTEAGSARYRIEVRSGDRLIEWQLGDGGGKLEYAALDGSSSCAWGDSGTFERQARTFNASADEQRAVLVARLTQGAYGQGYHALRGALSASDLHSFGTRSAGKDLLLALSYTSRSGADQRRLLLWIDMATKELRIVQELPGSGAAGTARDLWRLQQRQELPYGMPRARPVWAQPFRAVERLLDPSCPALDEQHVLSLRTIVEAGQRVNSQYVPVPPPADTTRAVLISSTTLSADIVRFPLDIRAIFLGDERWLRVGGVGRGLVPSQSKQRGQWFVSMSRSGADLNVTLCMPLPESYGCAETLNLAARGWSEDELLALIDTLQPLGPENWGTLDGIFLDPLALPPSAHSLRQPRAPAPGPQLGGPRDERLMPALVAKLE